VQTNDLAQWLFAFCVACTLTQAPRRYIALASLVVNIVISAVLSVVLNPVRSDRHKDVTVAGDYA
jgi:hypothetical protein